MNKPLIIGVAGGTASGKQVFQRFYMMHLQTVPLLY